MLSIVSRHGCTVCSRHGGSTEGAERCLRRTDQTGDTLCVPTPARVSTTRRGQGTASPICAERRRRNFAKGLPFVQDPRTVTMCSGPGTGGGPAGGTLCALGAQRRSTTTGRGRAEAETWAEIRGIRRTMQVACWSSNAHRPQAGFETRVLISKLYCLKVRLVRLYCDSDVRFNMRQLEAVVVTLTLSSQPEARAVGHPAGPLAPGDPHWTALGPFNGPGPVARVAPALCVVRGRALPPPGITDPAARARCAFPPGMARAASTSVLNIWWASVARRSNCDGFWHFFRCAPGPPQPSVLLARTARPKPVRHRRSGSRTALDQACDRRRHWNTAKETRGRTCCFSRCAAKMY